MIARIPVIWASLVLLAVACLAAEPPQPVKEEPKAKEVDDVQDFVYLTESRPVFVRMHVRVDDKPFASAWDNLIKYLFAHLDVDGNGTLSKEEVERAPTAAQLQGGVIGQFGGGGGFGRKRPAVAGITMEAVDADKDGKVTCAELADYYRKNGFTPFQVQASAQANPIAAAQAFLGGPGPEPSVRAVSQAIFKLLDTDGDGKLTKDELAKAPEVLIKLDADEDEIITTRELLPNESPNPLAGLMAMGMGGNQGKNDGNKTLTLIATAGVMPPKLVAELQKRYGLAADKPEEKKLSCKELGLDDATFRLLDANGDGVLDASELAGFVTRSPDLEMVLHLGKKKEVAMPRIKLVAAEKPAPLAAKADAKAGAVQLDLGGVQVAFTAGDDSQPDALGSLVREFFTGQFKQLDANGNGFVKEADVQKNGAMRGLFKAMDRDGDGKVTEKEMLAHLDHLQELQKRVAAASVTLELSDRSQGLFAQMDTNGDGQLGLRELRDAVKLLDRLDRDRKGFLTQQDIPHNYRLTLRQGPVAPGGFNPATAFFNLYRDGNQVEPEQAGTGPAWFRKMDRNRDGDISRKEFLFGEELFRKMDTDGDGLISLEEALRYDAMQKAKGKR